jgi:hypothetical protein
MIFVETQQCHEVRKLEEQYRLNQEILKHRATRLHPIADEIMLIVANHSEPEIRNTTIINLFSKRMGAHGRKERHEWRMKALCHLSSLIKTGMLEWGDKRNHVRLAPPEKHQEFLAKIDHMIASLPPPRL